MTSMTDMRGQKTTYEYDGNQRLYRIKDHQGNIIKHICYNYAGQPTDCSVSYVPVTPPAQVIYARVEATNIGGYSGGSGTYEDPGTFSTDVDVYIRLYTDAACTTPYVLPAAMNVNMQENYNYDNNGSPGSNVFTVGYAISVNTSQLFLGRMTVRNSTSAYEPGVGGYSSSYERLFSIVPLSGTNYTSLSTYGTY